MEKGGSIALIFIQIAYIGSDQFENMIWSIVQPNSRGRVMRLKMCKGMSYPIPHPFYITKS